MTWRPTGKLSPSQFSAVGTNEQTERTHVALSDASLEFSSAWKGNNSSMGATKACVKKIICLTKAKWKVPNRSKQTTNYKKQCYSLKDINIFNVWHFQTAVYVSTDLFHVAFVQYKNVMRAETVNYWQIM